MKTAKWHILFWVVYFTAIFIIDTLLDPYMTLIKEIIFFLSQNILLFYGLLYFLQKFSSRSKLTVFISISRLLIVIGTFITIRYFIRYHFLATYFEKEYGELPLQRWFPTCAVWIINSFFYALAYFYFQTSIKRQKALLKTQEEKLTQENEKIQLENIALRAQINPHFLYNTLDLLYAKALPKDAELSDGIMRLSEIMRYSLKAQDDQGLILLSNEIEHLENIIAINKLRFSHSLYISFRYEGKAADNRIIPLVLITLLENVLKHGQLNEPEHPAAIFMNIHADTLDFTTANKKRIGPKEISTGIGLNNTQKRLKYVYGDHYHFESRDEEGYFYTRLSIPLTK